MYTLKWEKTLKVTRIFQGRRGSLELWHLDKHSLTTQERKAPHVKNI